MELFAKINNAFSCYIFLQNSASQMFDRVLNTPLKFLKVYCYISRLLSPACTQSVLIFECTNFSEFLKIETRKNSHNSRFMKKSAREKKSNFENLVFTLNKILNSLILKVLLPSMLLFLYQRSTWQITFSFLSQKKVENFTFEKICTHEKIKKEIKQNLLKLVHTKIITHKVLHETNFY